MSRPGGNPGRTDQGNPAGGGTKNPGGKPKPKPRGENRARQRRREGYIGKALEGLQNAYIKQGLDPASAWKFAQVALSRPGVAISKGGRVHYKGTVFNATDFASSKLGQLVTGATAKAANEAAIKNDPTYRAAEAASALQRDQLAASLADARRQALIQFGDPTLVQGDAGTAAAAGANQFSTTALLRQQDVANRRNVQEGANQAGTLFGGGYQSGIGEANRVQAAGSQDAYTRINDLLSGSNLQNAQSQQNYDLTIQQALQEATQRLLASGALHAARAPNWQIRGYRSWITPGGHPAHAGGHPTGPGHRPPGVLPPRTDVPIAPTVPVPPPPPAPRYY